MKMIWWARRAHGGITFRLRSHLARTVRSISTRDQISSTGAADNKWGLRKEHLLNAACLRVDTAALLQRIAAGQGPLNVKTEEDGHYSPWSPALR